MKENLIQFPSNIRLIDIKWSKLMKKEPKPNTEKILYFRKIKTA
jgi:hypothetical protein